MSANWSPARYRALLKLLVRQMELDPRLQARFDSSDVVQDTLVRATEGLPGFRGTTEAELIAWLRVILGNVVADKIDAARAGKRDLAREQSLNAVLASSSARLEAFLVSRQPGPDEAAERHEDLVRLAEAIEGLPEAQRDALVRYRLLGQPIDEVAAALERSPEAVASLVFRATEALRQRLREAP